MAVGVPVITTNDCTTEMLPAELRPLLCAGRVDLGAQARLLHDLMGWNHDLQQQIGAQLRQNLVDHHSLDSLFDKILAIVEGHLAGDP